MTEQVKNEMIIRNRMHGLYLSRKSTDIVELAHELLGLHCWFHRNVCFSALIRGVEIVGWKNALTKTWLYRGTLHGVAYEDLPQLLALHPFESFLDGYLGREFVEKVAEEVLRYMEDGVYSRTEFRKIFADKYDNHIIDAIFSPWGGIFVHLARSGKVAFRDMTSRDFDMISAEPVQSCAEVLPELLHRYFEVYGPATLADAAWFFGFFKEDAKILNEISLDDLDCFEFKGKKHYYKEKDGIGDIPELTLLSGFDPIIVSYTDRTAILPDEYKSKVILKSGICSPTIAVNGKVQGIWNIKKNEPIVEFFTKQPKHIIIEAYERVEQINYQIKRVGKI